MSKDQPHSSLEYSRTNPRHVAIALRLMRQRPGKLLKMPPRTTATSKAPTALPPGDPTPEPTNPPQG